MASTPATIDGMTHPASRYGERTRYWDRILGFFLGFITCALFAIVALFVNYITIY